MFADLPRRLSNFRSASVRQSSYYNNYGRRTTVDYPVKRPHYDDRSATSSSYLNRSRSSHAGNVLAAAAAEHRRRQAATAAEHFNSSNNPSSSTWSSSDVQVGSRGTIFSLVSSDLPESEPASNTLTSGAGLEIHRNSNVNKIPPASAAVADLQQQLAGTEARRKSRSGSFIPKCKRLLYKLVMKASDGGSVSTGSVATGGEAAVAGRHRSDSSRTEIGVRRADIIISKPPIWERRCVQQIAPLQVRQAHRQSYRC